MVGRWIYRSTSSPLSFSILNKAWDLVGTAVVLDYCRCSDPKMVKVGHPNLGNSVSSLSLCQPYAKLLCLSSRVGPRGKKEQREWKDLDSTWWLHLTIQIPLMPELPHLIDYWFAYKPCKHIFIPWESLLGCAGELLVVRWSILSKKCPRKSFISMLI